jgi:hypothetical protein
LKGKNQRKHALNPNPLSRVIHTQKKAYGSHNTSKRWDKRISRKKRTMGAKRPWRLTQMYPVNRCQNKDSYEIICRSNREQCPFGNQHVDIPLDVSLQSLCNWTRSMAVLERERGGGGKKAGLEQKGVAESELGYG